MSHYTAVVVISRVTDGTEARVDSYGKTTTPAVDRKVDEVAKIVVRAADVDTLVEKTTKHLELIDEDNL